MALKDHVTPRMVVPLIGDNSVAVRGFNLDDFAALMPNHFEAVTKIAELYGQHKQSVFSGKAFSDFVLHCAKDFPGLVAEVISIAADEPDAKNVKLGTALQISILTAIVKLTVEEAGGLGNLFGQLRALGVNALLAQAELASQKPRPSNIFTGTGESQRAS